MFFKFSSIRSRQTVVFTPSLSSNLFSQFISFNFQYYNLFVSFNYDVQSLRGDIAITERHGYAHLEAEAED